MKVYLNSPKENWIVDRFVKEWKNIINKIPQISLKLLILFG